MFIPVTAILSQNGPVGLVTLQKPMYPILPLTREIWQGRVQGSTDPSWFSSFSYLVYFYSIQVYLNTLKLYLQKAKSEKRQN